MSFYDENTVQKGQILRFLCFNGVFAWEGQYFWRNMFPPTKKRIMEGIRDLFKLSEARKQGAAKLTVFFID